MKNSLSFYIPKFKKLFLMILFSPFWFLGRIFQTFRRELLQENKTFYELEKLAYKESAKYIFDNLSQAVLMTNLKEFRAYVLNAAPSKGLVMEFGVFKGDSINQYAQVLIDNNDSRTIYGFDSFEGLSENWAGYSLMQSKFNQAGKMPAVRENVKLIKGWVDDTYVDFLKNNVANHDHQIAFMFLDMDTYNPTKYVLEASLPYLVKGSVIAFDELLGYTGWRENEFKALMETVDKKFEFEYIVFSEHRVRGYVSMYTRAGIRITGEKK